MLNSLEEMIENSKYTKGEIIDPKLVEHAKGMVCFQNKDYIQAMNHFKVSAEHNNPNSYYIMAVMYEHSLGVEEDLEKALDYFVLASEEVPKALKYLAIKYFNGSGTEINMNESFKNYMNIYTIYEDDSVLFNIGYMYYYGHGVEKNQQEALNYFLKAYYSGDKKATIALGKMYLNGEGIDVNYPEAFKFLKLATQEGYGEAAFSLGLMLEQGLGLPINKRQALIYYKEANKLGFLCYNKIEEIEKKISYVSFYYKNIKSKIKGIKK